MINFLREYAEKNDLLRDTAEETINAILENLAKDPENQLHLKYRNELISSSAVALNGLSRINDPVKLFRNLGNAFERRGECIYTETVRNAFNRLYLNAIKMGKEKEILKVWDTLTNAYTKAVASRYIPINLLYSLLNNPDESMLVYLVDNLARRKDVPLAKLKYLLKNIPYDLVKLMLAEGLVSKKEVSSKYVYELLRSPNKNILEGAINALPLRTDLSISFLRKLLYSLPDDLKISVAYSLILRKDLPEKDIKDLLNSSNKYIKEGAREALVHRTDIPLKYIPDLPKDSFGYLPNYIIHYLALKLPLAKLKELLKNHDDAIVDVASSAILKRKDLPLKFVLDLTKSDNMNVKENAYTALFYRKDISREKVFKLLGSEKANTMDYYWLDFLKKSMLKHIRGSRGYRKRKMRQFVKPLTNSYNPRNNRTKINRYSTHLK